VHTLAQEPLRSRLVLCGEPFYGAGAGLGGLRFVAATRNRTAGATPTPAPEGRRIDPSRRRQPGAIPRAPPAPSRRGDRRRDSNKPQPSDRRSDLFAASDWRISWVDEEKPRLSRRGLRPVSYEDDLFRRASSLLRPPGRKIRWTAEKTPRTIEIAR
jgi:hypothetical protein